MYAKHSFTATILLVCLLAVTGLAQWTNPNPDGEVSFTVMVSSNHTLLFPPSLGGTMNITGGSATNLDLLGSSFGIGIASNTGREGGTAITDGDLFIYEHATNELTNTFQYIGGSTGYVPVVVDIDAGTLSLSNLASVSDTRLVTNLNAEYLGGLPAASYSTGIPVHVESDPIWAAASNLYARLFVPVASSSNYLFFTGSGTVEGCITNGSGSGFPLTKNESAAWYSITNVGTVVASNGQFGAIEADSATLNGNLDINNGNVDIIGDVSIYGDLTVTGTTWSITTINQITNVNMGTVTNWYTEARYYTSYWSQIIYTNIITTNSVTTYIVQGGSIDATNATYVALPDLYIAGNTATATGIWDFTGAVVTGLQAGGSSGTEAEAEPGVVTPEASVTVPLSNWLQYYAPTGATAISIDTKTSETNIASVRLDLDLSLWGADITFETNNLSYTWTALASGSVHTLLFDSPAMTTNWTGRELE